MVLIEDANVFLTQATGLALSVIALAGLALKFAMSRNHSPRLVALEKDMQAAKADVQQIQQDTPDILKAVAVTDALVPQLGEADKAHQAEILKLRQEMADAKAKIDMLTTLAASVSARAGAAPVAVAAPVAAPAHPQPTQPEPQPKSSEKTAV